MQFIPHTPEDKEAMLRKVGVKSFEELIEAIPEQSKLRTSLKIPARLSEEEMREVVEELGKKNTLHTCFAGGGAYDHFVPSVVDSILSRPEFYTAYTPYQAEISQGTLQSIYEYQSMICELMSMEVSNASMYDGGSALAEAVHLARSISGRGELLLSDLVNPAYQEVIETYCRGLGLGVRRIRESAGKTDLENLREKVDAKTACVVIQHPNFLGCLEEPQLAADIAHQQGALLVVCVDPISLGVLKPPGEYDADVAVAEGQCLGLPISFGGPFLGIFATKREYVRFLPGRLAGATEDKQGRRGFVLTIQTREQHIRRERATSNICTNQALCALAASVYLSLLGREGLVEVGRLCLQKSHYLADRFSQLPGWRLPFKNPFFKEFCVEPPVEPEEVVEELEKRNILAGIPLGRFKKDWQKYLLVAVTERRKREEMNEFVEAMGQIE